MPICICIKAGLILMPGPKYTPGKTACETTCLNGLGKKDRLNVGSKIIKRSGFYCINMVSVFGYTCGDV